MKSTYKRCILVALSFVFLLGTGFNVSNVNAQEAQEAVNCEEYYDYINSQDDRGFYNPCAGNAGGPCSAAGTGSLTGPAPTELTGESNAQKTWNYFIGRGLTPIAAAGALGNIEQESGFDPWIRENSSPDVSKTVLQQGIGLIQWTNTDGNTNGRRYQVMQYMEDNGVSLTPDDPSQLDKALLTQLNFLWDGEYGSMTWQEQVNAETTIEGDPSKPTFGDNTGNGTALQFHALVERSGDGPDGKQERIDSAKKYLEQFGAGGGTCTISEGGLTEDQATKLMDAYRNEPDSQTRVYPGMDWFFSPGPSDCPGKPNCTAFSTYFVSRYTSMQADANGNGNEKADRLLAINPSAQSGDTPKPFAIFQTNVNSLGHTGVILGVEGDKVIIGEANCGDGPSGIRVRVSTVAEMSSGYKYMYTDGSVNNAEIQGVIGG